VSPRKVEFFILVIESGSNVQSVIGNGQGESVTRRWLSPHSLFCACLDIARRYRNCRMVRRGTAPSAVHPIQWRETHRDARVAPRGAWDGSRASRPRVGTAITGARKTPAYPAAEGPKNDRPRWPEPI
jgi:hypothetical protein